MYLRKSRQDDPNETVEEVLAKHEIWLQDWAEKNLGYRIPEEYIIREIVSIILFNSSWLGNSHAGLSRGSSQMSAGANWVECAKWLTDMGGS